jgi:hypothetical protein
VLKKTICLLAFTLALLPAVQGQAASDIVIERHVAMKTRDGVTLKADIYKPAGEGKFPVLLQRTPYDKNGAEGFARQAVARGYMVVVQDVRGRYASEGEWYPFKHETDDGYDTIEWAAALPNSNGKVGMFGGSYVGATQMLASIGHPPHLAGICPEITGSNYHENWTYQGGAFEQWFNQSWTSGLVQDTLNRVAREQTNALTGSFVLPLTDFPVINIKAPLDGPGLTKTLAPYYIDWLAHPTYDSYWKQWSIEDNFAQVQVPALTIGSWYDIFQAGSLNNFVGLKAHAGNEAARKGQRLLMTIGGHAGGGRTIGTVDFGPVAEENEWSATTLDWYDYLLQGKQNRFATDKPVRIFVMGEDQWRDEDSWPLQRAKSTRYYLHSAGDANSSGGDGALSVSAAAAESADSFVYNPTNPVYTTGGPLCCDANNLVAGPMNQQKLETRQDVLVYSTLPLDTDLEVTGPVSLDLFASSSAVDTDFTAKLVDVWPNGYAQDLTEGILRARYRDSKETATPLIPGKVYELKIDLWSTSNVFLKGHKIRIEVSSSNFPRFDRNPNTGKTAGEDATFVKATNTVYHDAAHPSAVVLPVVPR